MDKDKITAKQVIGPFDLKPGESKEFTLGIPIPEGMTPEETIEMLKKSEIIVTGSYQDKDGKEYHFKERVKYEERRKINELSMITLVVGIIFLIVAAHSIITGVAMLAIIWIFLAIVNFYYTYRFGIWKKVT